MSATTTTAPRVLVDALPGARVRDAALVGGFALAIAASAQLAVPLPFTPVPITGQTLVVLLGAIVLGATRATAGSLLYIAAGVAGVPWFAVTGGATIGYIVGFVAAASVVGFLAQRGAARSPLQVAGAMALGNAVIYAFGATGLMLLFGLSPVAAFTAGVAPFLLGDAVKVAIAVALVPAAWRLVGGER